MTMPSQPRTFAERAAMANRVEPMNVPTEDQQEGIGASLQLSDVVRQIQNSLSDANFYFQRVLEERVETLDTLIYEPFRFQLDTTVNSFEFDIQPQSQQVVLIDTVMAWLEPSFTNQILQQLPATPPNFAIKLPMLNSITMTLPLTGSTSAGAVFYSSLYSPTKLILDGRLRKLYGSMSTGNFPAGFISGMLCGKAVPATLAKLT